MANRDEMIDLLTLRLARFGFPLDDLKRELYIVFKDFEIERREMEIVPYSGGKTRKMIERFIISKGIAGLTKRTLQLYGTALTRCFTLMQKDYDEVTSEDVQLLIGRIIANGDSKNYANHQRVILNGFYNWLIKEEIYTKNPVAKVEHIKYVKKQQRALTDIEVEKIRDACRTGRERAIIDLLLSTGCRASEMCSLRVEDVKNDEVEIIGKGEKPRTVYINAKARISVDRYLAEREDDNPWLFPASVMKNGKNIAELHPKKENKSTSENWYKDKDLVSDKPVERDYMNVCVKRIAKRAGVKGVHTHMFRRTCATNALKHGMPIELVRMMLGHTNIQTTQIYLDISVDELKQAHNRYVV